MWTGLAIPAVAGAAPAVAGDGDSMSSMPRGVARRSAQSVKSDLSLTTTKADPGSGEAAAARTLVGLRDDGRAEDAECASGATCPSRFHSLSPFPFLPAGTVLGVPMQRRIAKILATTAVLGLTLAACGSNGGGGGGGGSTDAMQAKGPITIWYSNNEAEVGWGKAMVEAWNSAHADQKIEAQEIPAGKSSEEVIGAAITAGTAPCLVFNTAPAAVGQFQRQGGLVDLSKFPDGTSYIEGRSGDVAQQYKAADGGYYQLPWKSNPVMIFYNKDLFKKAGLDAESPKLSTYDDFLAAAKKIKDSGAAKYAINPAPTSEFYQTLFDFVPLYAAESGGKQIVADGKATFNDASGLAVANFWKSIYADGLAGKEQIQGDAFASKVAAMAIVGPWAIAVYKGKVNWGAVPVPTSKGVASQSDLHLQRRQEHRSVHRLQEPGHCLGGAEVRHQLRAGRRAADQDRPDAASQGSADHVLGLLHQEPRVQAVR